MSHLGQSAWRIELARPRERGLKPERGAERAAAERSGAALILITANFGNAALRQRGERRTRSTGGRSLMSRPWQVGTPRLGLRHGGHNRPGSTGLLTAADITVWWLTRPGGATAPVGRKPQADIGPGGRM
jgi:hypothetical protein